MTPKRVACIDVGTNSVLLLVAERRDGAVAAVIERATITRLGQGVDASRALAPDAVERTLSCLAEYAEEIREAGATAVDAVGTSAMRDARGGEDFVARAAALLGRAPRVISGDEEASLTYRGARSGLSLPRAPLVVFDVGGGSTEIIVGDATGAIERALSLDIGSVRLTERHLRGDPPAQIELEAARADARAALATVDWPAARGATLLGVAGTITTLAAVARGVAPYDAARIHGAALSAADIDAWAARLAALTLAERRGVRALDPKRADVLVAGALIVSEVLSAAKASEVIVSDRGVRWGLAEALLLD